jgi:hypothetical protein
MDTDMVTHPKSTPKNDIENEIDIEIDMGKNLSDDGIPV